MVQSNSKGFEVDGGNIPQYSGVDRIVLITEDDPAQRLTLENIAKDQFKNDSRVSICSAQDTVEAAKHLNNYHMFSPEAWLNAILDYNFGDVVSGGDRKPAEALFYNDDFKHYINKGGVVVIYSGSYTKQAQQSPIIIDAISRNPYFALFFAQKATVKGEDVVKFTRNIAKKENIATLRAGAERFNYNLGEMLVAVRSRQK
jgi:hypothetical protein